MEKVESEGDKRSDQLDELLHEKGKRAATKKQAFDRPASSSSEMTAAMAEEQERRETRRRVPSSFARLSVYFTDKGKGAQCCPRSIQLSKLTSRVLLG